ncbi:hypothetical protein M408DRAFT_326864 [Serendipita vermifera MAFF 305830]|uniref:Uncharacterized protein n=1 Tax=Serendipita vermifera MAFF 305830 TaxID=933852 RepID=A0A0C2X1U7_SERVB|nr:hypothetical protein M408DRAFT_326864 [Serendipita vermifera MAFF 305830]
MQAQIFPRGTYAPAMGVFSFGQDPRQMTEDVQVLFGAPAPVTKAPSSVRQQRQRQPQFSAAAHFAALQRSASPPSSSTSHASDEVSSSEGEDDSSASSSCNGSPTVSEKLSRAFKSLRKMSTK